MAKSADAFRTISEVADWLGIPAHVLRFWESKFTQVKPVKRAGGRRYYRPADMQLLGGIRKLLHEDGMTIKGVQKILREQGIKEVSTLSPPLDNDGTSDNEISGIALDVTAESDEPKGKVLSFERDKPAAPSKAPKAVVEAAAPSPDTAEGEVSEKDVATTAKDPDETAISLADDDTERSETFEKSDTSAATAVAQDAMDAQEQSSIPGFLNKSLQERSDEEGSTDEPAQSDNSTSSEVVEAVQDHETESTGTDEDALPPQPTPITTPPDPADDAETASGAILTTLTSMTVPTITQAEEIAALRDRLIEIHTSGEA